MLLLFLIFIFSDVHSSVQLYGLHEDFLQILKLDKTTAKETPVGTKYSDVYDGQQLVSVDKSRRIFCIVGANVTSKRLFLYSLDLDTGEMKYPPLHIPIQSGIFLGKGTVMQVDQDSGDVIVMGYGADAKQKMMIITPSTGTIKDLGSNKYKDAGPLSAYSEKSKLFYIIYYFENKFFVTGWDKSGKEVFNVPNDGGFQSFKYDSVSQKFWGVGMKDKGRTRTVINMDLNGNFTEVAVLNQYYFVLTGITAIDEEKRELYFLLQNRKYTPGDVHFDLITFDMEQGKIKNAAECTDQKTPGEEHCVWGMDTA